MRSAAPARPISGAGPECGEDRSGDVARAVVCREGCLEHQHGQDRTDRIDERALGFEKRTQATVESDRAHDRTDHGRAGDDQHSRKEDREVPVDVEDVAGRKSGADEGDRSADAEQNPDGVTGDSDSFPAQSKRTFEEDDSDGE